MRKFPTQSPRRCAFECGHDTRWGIHGQAVEKPLHGVRHRFHRDHNPSVGLTDFVDQFFKPHFSLTDPYLAPIARAEAKNDSE